MPAAPGPVTLDRTTSAEDEGAGPTVPAQPPAAGSLRLNAISQRDGRPVALINDRLLFEGDSFDGVKVLRIGEAEVEVEVHGKGASALLSGAGHRPAQTGRPLPVNTGAAAPEAPAGLPARRDRRGSRTAADSWTGTG